MSRVSSLPIARHNSLQGIMLMLSAFGIFSVMDAIVKWMSGDFALLQIVLIRTLFSLPIVSLIVYFRGGFKLLKTKTPGWQVVRGVAMFSAYIFFFMALAALPYSTMIAIFFSGPLFITALSGPLLGEPVGWRRWMAVLIGFVGVLVIIRPAGGQFEPATIYALLAAFVYAISIIYTRKVEDSGATTSFYTAVVYLAAALIFSPIFAAIDSSSSHPSITFLTMAWPTPQPADILLIFVLALGWGVGMVLLSTAYRGTPVATLAPFEYFSIVYGIIIGYLVWQEVPKPAMLAGTGLIVACGLFIIYRERQLEMKQPAIVESVGDPVQEGPITEVTDQI